jgi:K+/H+ antiporter YhaU regulatory subunit KhtT
MIAIISFFIVILVSLLITRIAAISLIHTGLSDEAARFQARSAFTGVGFTTSESEQVVNHPVRRRIVLLLMLFGNAGIVTAISALILTFVHSQDAGTIGLKLLLIFSGITLFWFIARSKTIDRFLFKVISKALKKYTDLEVRDFISLLRLSGDYRVTELNVEPQDWMANQSLIDLRLGDEGVLILGIIRKDSYLGSPKAKTIILPGDILILYGRISNFESLDKRKKGISGDKEHEKAVKEHTKIEEIEYKEISIKTPKMN